MEDSGGIMHQHYSLGDSVIISSSPDHPSLEGCIGIVKDSYGLIYLVEMSPEDLPPEYRDTPNVWVLQEDLRKDYDSCGGSFEKLLEDLNDL